HPALIAPEAARDGAPRYIRLPPTTQTTPFIPLCESFLLGGMAFATNPASIAMVRNRSAPSLEVVVSRLLLQGNQRLDLAGESQPALEFLNRLVQRGNHEYPHDLCPRDLHREGYPVHLHRQHLIHRDEAELAVDHLRDLPQQSDVGGHAADVVGAVRGNPHLVCHYLPEEPLPKCRDELLRPRGARKDVPSDVPAQDGSRE